MKRSRWLAVLMAAVLLCAACGQSDGNLETPNQNSAGDAESGIVEEQDLQQPEQTDNETEETLAHVQDYTAADMIGFDPYEPNLSMSDINFSQQPYFASNDGMDEFFRDCVANRCRSIAFCCDISVQVDMDGGSFSEKYMTAWCIPKMQPGPVGKQYIFRVTYYPGDNVTDAYLSGDTSFLDPEELVLYDTAVAWLEENISDEMTDYEKCVVIHDYLSGTVQYSNELLDALNTSFTFDWGITAYGAMVDNISICQGYADAFNMLTSMLGMNCVQIFGYGSGAPHNWNLIELDGMWYHVDCTFDDMFGGNDGTSAKAYLFASDKQIGLTHMWDRNSYPKAGDDSLYYYAVNDLYVTNEENMAAKIGERLLAGERVDVYVKNLTKKQVTEYVQSLGAVFHASDYVNDFVLCAWIPVE